MAYRAYAREDRRRSRHGSSMRPAAVPAAVPHFHLRKRRRVLRAPSRDELKKLDLALPWGTYWRERVLAGDPYPPPGTSTPPKVCQRTGDVGRCYPGYYVACPSHGRQCCADCLNNWILERHLRLARWENSKPAEPRPPRDDSPGSTDFVCGTGYYAPEFLTDGIAYTAEELEASGELEPAADPSPTGEAIREMEAMGAVLIEAKLPSEDEEDLRAEVARYQAALPGSKVVTVKI